ncbi:hypothetical protein BT69DRAFT_1293879 [Atractiella rhizophila]|nr:hypothetical protein BT69DRAFT_1293879 [Atractiella rhizophila]
MLALLRSRPSSPTPSPATDRDVDVTRATGTEEMASVEPQAVEQTKTVDPTPGPVVPEETVVPPAAEEVKGEEKKEEGEVKTQEESSSASYDLDLAQLCQLFLLMRIKAPACGARLD